MDNPELIADLGVARIYRTVVSESWHTNVYLVSGVKSGCQLLIDPAADPVAIEAMLTMANVDALDVATKVKAIAITHQHHDHIGALPELVKLTGAPVYAGRDDAVAITSQTGVTVTCPVAAGDQIDLGGLALGIIGISGHTPGSIVIVLRTPGNATHLFVGDDLFPGGVGKTWSAADFNTLFTEVRTKLFEQFPDDTVVWPGHGLPTTLGKERPRLPEWQARGW